LRVPFFFYDAAAARRGLTRRVRSMQRMIHFRRAIWRDLPRHCSRADPRHAEPPHLTSRPGRARAPRSLL